MPDADRTIFRQRVTRRRFLAVAGTSAAAAAVTQPIFSSPAFAATLTRFDVGGLTAKSKTITSYVAGIQAMQVLPDSDPTSWTYQAAIHGHAMVSPMPTAWATCQHGNDFFFSWHRMYLYWFERIVRKKSGDSSWTLPFWAWDSASERQIPSLFRTNSGALKTLYSSSRLGPMNMGGTIPASQVDTKPGFKAKYFAGSTGANGQFQIPHNNVHTTVGSGFSMFDTTALDPLFWLHHCNCDRLWNAWRGGSKRYDPVSNFSWTNPTWTFFDENGKSVTMNSCDVVNTAKQLKYRYQGGPSLTAENCPIIKVVCCLPHIVVFPFSIPRIPPLGAQPVRVPLPIPPETRQRLTRVAADPSKSVFLHLQDMTAPTQPGGVWAVFVGPPSEPSAAVLGGSQPASVEDPYFIGTVTLFVNGVQNEMGGAAEIALPLNAALLASRNAQTLEITFVQQGVLLNGVQVRPQLRASLNIGKATIIVESEKSGTQTG